MSSIETTTNRVPKGAADRPWVARMVRPSSDGGVGTRAPFLRKVFALGSAPSEASLRISALGLYRCFINGVRVGNDQLTPGWTCYDERLSVQTYAVAHLLKAGENVIDIWLGDGWYRSPLMWKKTRVVNTWGEHVAAIAEISAGGQVLLATDDSWGSGLLPVLKSGIYFGEI